MAIEEVEGSATSIPYHPCTGCIATCLCRHESHVHTKKQSNANIPSLETDGDGLLIRGFEGFPMFHLYLERYSNPPLRAMFHRVETTIRIEDWLLFEFVQAASCRSLVCTSGSCRVSSAAKLDGNQLLFWAMGHRK